MTFRLITTTTCRLIPYAVGYTRHTGGYTVWQIDRCARSRLRARRRFPKVAICATRLTLCHCFAHIRRRRAARDFAIAAGGLGRGATILPPIFLPATYTPTTPLCHDVAGVSCCAGCRWMLISRRLSTPRQASSMSRRLARITRPASPAYQFTLVECRHSHYAYQRLEAASQPLIYFMIGRIGLEHGRCVISNMPAYWPELQEE